MQSMTCESEVRTERAFHNLLKLRMKEFNIDDGSYSTNKQRNRSKHPTRDFEIRRKRGEVGIIRLPKPKDQKLNTYLARFQLSQMAERRGLCLVSPTYWSGRWYYAYTMELSK